MSTAKDNQIGGAHYKTMRIQPLTYAYANDFDAYQFSVLKYISRHKTKNGVEDLDKAIHILEMYKQEIYGENN